VLAVFEIERASIVAAAVAAVETQVGAAQGLEGGGFVHAGWGHEAAPEGDHAVGVGGVVSLVAEAVEAAYGERWVPPGEDDAVLPVQGGAGLLADVGFGAVFFEVGAGGDFYFW
jgi:hypothetical protein